MIKYFKHKKDKIYISKKKKKNTFRVKFANIIQPFSGNLESDSTSALSNTLSQMFKKKLDNNLFFNWIPHCLNPLSNISTLNLNGSIADASLLQVPPQIPPMCRMHRFILWE